MADCPLKFASRQGLAHDGLDPKVALIGRRHRARTAGLLAVARANAHRQRVAARHCTGYRMHGRGLHPLLQTRRARGADARGIGHLPDPGVWRAVGHPVPGRATDAQHGDRLRRHPARHVALDRRVRSGKKGPCKCSDHSKREGSAVAFRPLNGPSSSCPGWPGRAPDRSETA